VSASRFDFRESIKLGITIFVVLLGFVWAFENPASPFFLDLQLGHIGRSFSPTLVAISTFLLAMAIGSQVTLFRQNRHRLRSVLRPNLGRVVSAVVLAILLPYYVLDSFPVTFLFALVVVFGKIVSGDLAHPEILLALTGFVLFGCPAAYVFASLIISGVQSRWVRVALFGQVWLGVYGAVLLVIGIQTFP
jgi:hypothetical protein